jgi:error-prone DNA polymerase
MTDRETVGADLWATGMSPGHSPVEFARPYLQDRGAVVISELGSLESGSRVLIGGVVTHRQRPATAMGVTFVNLEDETGMANVICSKGAWSRYRRIARMSTALVVRGKLEHQDGVINVIADKIEVLKIPGENAIRARDFH